MTDNTITTHELAGRLGGPHWPRIVDVRIDADVAPAPLMLPCSERVAHTALDEFQLPQHQSVVVVCHKGLKLSQGAAALLRARGIAARYLKGGHVAWSDAGLPLVNGAARDRRWTLPVRPQAAELAAGWMIQRFLDPSPVFLFADADQTSAVAERFAAPLAADAALALRDVIGCLPLSETLLQVLRGLAEVHADDLDLCRAALPLFDGLYRANREGAGHAA